MHKKGYLLSALIIVLLIAMIVITYGSIVITNAQGLDRLLGVYIRSETFRLGVTTGFLGCLFLSSILLLFLAVSRSTSFKKLRLVILLLFSLFIALAIFWSFKPGDSDTWWYGVIAGYLICEAIFLPLTISYLAYKLLTRLSRSKISS
jgi:hypothetical protein